MRTFHHREFPAERFAERRSSISVCVPALNEAATIGATVRILAELRERGAIDQVVVVDGASTDDTARIAAEHGAEVHQQDGLLPQLGPVLGKGDAMWRALTVLEGDLVCFVDADSEDFAPHFPCGLLGPLLFEEGVEYVKGFYRRPFKSGTAIAPQGGGRVTELTARPLLEVFYPELAACRQPLAGEIAAPRSLLERLPWATGYGAEIAQLLDVHREVGLGAMAQVDLDVRQNIHQPLSALGPMAATVVKVVADRLAREGRLDAAPSLVERPPLRTLRAPVPQ
ncbi:MAG: glucosyl-3-phosphoglycerate synthase [Actinobacteria bacterium]|nr:MAG: glucosyl-3-phosphoglycerate synthase [Actinomycetota bacterium]